jgi:hypothetical protein
MNTGTQAAREAGNMVDLDSNPTKLIEIVEIGKQLLMTRGSLTTFSIANDVAKYFAIIPAAFASPTRPINPQHHGPGHARQRHPVGRDLQRADHRRPDPAGLGRSASPSTIPAISGGALPPPRPSPTTRPPRPAPIWGRPTTP